MLSRDRQLWGNWRNHGRNFRHYALAMQVRVYANHFFASVPYPRFDYLNWRPVLHKKRHSKVTKRVPSADFKIQLPEQRIKMLIQHRLVAQRRPRFGNEHQSAFAPRETLFQHFRYVRLNVDCPLWFLGLCGHPTPHATPHVHHVARSTGLSRLPALTKQSADPGPNKFV
jgi:hypothetical protein